MIVILLSESSSGLVVLQDLMQFTVLAMPSPSNVFCNVVPWIELAGAVVLLILTGFAMVIRVYALWNRDKRVLTAVLALCLLQIVFYTIAISYAYANGVLMPELPPFTGCVVIFGFDGLWAIFIPNIIFETTIVALIVYKTWYFVTQGDIRTPLYTMLFNDGLAYYLAIIASQILVFVCVMAPSILTIPVVRSFFAFAVMGTACNRLLARLQRLMLSKGKGQSGFSTVDVWSMAPRTVYGSRETDSEANPQLPDRLEEHPTRLGVTRTDESKHHRKSRDFDNAIAMEPMPR
ncbi:hypothetical protein M408DRAFT_327327 [Serendipita vermifera MAFF 305830]|uniref:G-protein coupled receptors family 3 profile domain-containing protein n=1 Tax=Serendipita vermifera MAFF 305830 TaxID=933852 RepID=A0A0C3BKD3_SERVB|nr:hypothetical protein M408DRAFT_327327 [Serendipita vermifera MAFF 305830]